MQSLGLLQLLRVRNRSGTHRLQGQVALLRSWFNYILLQFVTRPLQRRMARPFFRVTGPSDAITATRMASSTWSTWSAVCSLMYRVQQLGMRGLLGQANGIRGRMVLQVPSGVNVARLNRDFVIFRRLWRNPRRWRQRKRRRRRRSRIRSWRTRRWTARRRTLSVTSK